MNPNSSKVVLINLEESVIAALAKLTPDASLPVEGKLVPSADLREQIQAHLDMMKSANDARARFAEFVMLDRSQRARMRSMLGGIRNYAAGLFGENSAEFASFGFKPKKVAERSVHSKAEAVEKLRATRLARHTMGKRQKAGIHGQPQTPPAATGAPVDSGTNGTPTANAFVKGVSS